MDLSIRTILYPEVAVMAIKSLKRQTMLWLALLFLTLLSAEVLRRRVDIVGYSIDVIAVLLVMLIKARIIGLDFMELRGAPRRLRLAFEAWLVMVSLGILFLHTVPQGAASQALTKSAQLDAGATGRPRMDRLPPRYAGDCNSPMRKC